MEAISLKNIKNEDRFKDMAKKFSALDNEVKLKILTLLVEQGTKSITDISKELKLNFSTTHKYLEQLEKAGLVTSKEVAENRLKRLFYVSNFNIDLSPQGLASTPEQRKTQASKATFKVLNEHGEEVNFDSKLFLQKYLKRGLPQSTAMNVLANVLPKAYDGITLLELRSLYSAELKLKAGKITGLLENVYQDELRRKTYASVLALHCPELLEKHKSGEIFIKNLGKPRLLNFVHDVRGIAIHGISGKKPETLGHMIDQLLKVSSELGDILGPYQAIDSFNYIFAPLASKVSDLKLRQELIRLLQDFEKLNVVLYLNLDVGIPRFTESISPHYFYKPKQEIISYTRWALLASKITQMMIDIKNQFNLKNIILGFKIWDKAAYDKLNLNSLSKFFVFNMQPAWQNINASYIGEKVRMDASWKGWMRTIRCGEFQSIILNLPHLAFENQNQNDFFKKLKYLLLEIIHAYIYIAELNHGEFLREKRRRLLSAETEKWNYIPTEDGLYTFSILGLNEAVYLLTGKELDVNFEFGKKILEFCNKVIQTETTSIPIRLAIKCEYDSAIGNRFYHIDSKNYANKLKISKYSFGIACSDKDISLKLQPYLPGGHCITLSKQEAKTFLSKNSDFGAAYFN